VSPTALDISFHNVLNTPEDIPAGAPLVELRFFRTSSTALLEDAPAPSKLVRTLIVRFFDPIGRSACAPPFVILGLLERRNLIKDINARATIRSVATFVREVKEDRTKDSMDFTISNVEGILVELAETGGSTIGAFVTGKRCFCLYLGFGVTDAGIGVAVRDVLVEFETEEGWAREVIDIGKVLRLPLVSSVSNLAVRGVAVSSLEDDALESAGDAGLELPSDVGDREGVEGVLDLRRRAVMASERIVSSVYIRWCRLTDSSRLSYCRNSIA